MPSILRKFKTLAAATLALSLSTAVARAQEIRIIEVIETPITVEDADPKACPAEKSADKAKRAEKSKTFKKNKSAEKSERSKPAATTEAVDYPDRGKDTAHSEQRDKHRKADDGRVHSAEKVTGQADDHLAPDQANKGTAEDREAARKHFLAGFRAGYANGYYDGYDDSILWIVELGQKHRGHQAHQSERIRNPYEETDRDRQQVRNRDDERGDRYRLREQMRQRTQPQPAFTGMQEISGEVLDVKTVPIRGTSTSHTVVRLVTDFGRRRVVDLGPCRCLENVEIKPGERITVQGHVVDTPDMPVMAAHRVAVDKQLIDVDYQRPERVREAADKADQAEAKEATRPPRQ